MQISECLFLLLLYSLSGINKNRTIIFGITVSIYSSSTMILNINKCNRIKKHLGFVDSGVKSLELILIFIEVYHISCFPKISWFIKKWNLFLINLPTEWGILVNIYQSSSMSVCYMVAFSSSNRSFFYIFWNIYYSLSLKNKSQCRN